MTTRWYMALVLLWHPLAASAQTHSESNAAHVLRRAFAALPETPSENPSEKLKQIEPSLALLYEAAVMPHCDWGLPYLEQGFNTLMPHLGKVRDLSRLADWRATLRLEDDPAGYVSDQLAALAAARHTGRNEPLIALLVEQSIESKVIESLAENARDLPEETLGDLIHRWRGLEPGSDLRVAMWMEKAAGTDGLIKRIRAASEKAAAASFSASSANSLADELRVSGIVRVDGKPVRIGLETADGESLSLRLGQKRRGIEFVSADYEKEEAVLYRGDEVVVVKLKSREVVPLEFVLTEEILAILGEDTREQVEKKGGTKVILGMLEETSAQLDRLIEALALPRDVFRRWNDAFEKELNGLSSVTRSIIPAVSKARNVADKGIARRAMLTAALDVVRQGPDALPRHQDPFGNGPFNYRATNSGFELESGLVIDGKPVTLRVGQQDGL